MSQAQVRSTDALYEFRAALIEFASVAHQSLDMLGVEARRGAEYITIDRVKYWRNENRKAWDAVARAKDAFHQARIQRTIADHTSDCIDERKALQRAQDYLKLTEQKLEALKHWCREITHTFNEFEGRYSLATSAADGDVPNAMVVLERIIRQLEEYYRLTAPVNERLVRDESNASNVEPSAVVITNPPATTPALEYETTTEIMPAATTEEHDGGR
jgi:hypothetical protein